jgi:hypothetical protein
MRAARVRLLFSLFQSHMHLHLHLHLYTTFTFTLLFLPTKSCQDDLTQLTNYPLLAVQFYQHSFNQAVIANGTTLTFDTRGGYFGATRS